MLASVSADDLFKPSDGMGGLDDQGAGIHGLVFVERIVGVVRNAGALRERQKVHGVVLPIDAGVGGVFHHADDLMRSILTGLAGAGTAKVMADGVALAEEQLDELLIDDGDRWRIHVSCNVKPRPITTWVPTESKYSEVPLTQDAPLLISGSP